DLTKDDHDSAPASTRPAYEGRHHHRPGIAMEPSTATTSHDTKVVGDDWTQVVIANGVELPVRGWGLREATTPVSGSWGSGRLLHTALANVLFLEDGRVAAGFVNASALEAAVAHG